MLRWVGWLNNAGSINRYDYPNILKIVSFIYKNKLKSEADKDNILLKILFNWKIDLSVKGLNSIISSMQHTASFKKPWMLSGLD